MNTQKGQTCYRMHLMQIRNAVLETLYYATGAIEEYLMCHEYNSTWNKRHGKAMSAASVREDQMTGRQRTASALWRHCAHGTRCRPPAAPDAVD